MLATKTELMTNDQGDTIKKKEEKKEVELGLYWQTQHPRYPVSSLWESSVNLKLLLQTNKGFVCKQEGSVRKPVLHEYHVQSNQTSLKTLFV